MIFDYAKIAFTNLRRRRKRTLLTLIGIFIGIAAVVSLMSIGQGLEAVITEQFEMMGTDKVMVYPEGGFFGIGSGSELTEGDMDFINKISGVKIATAFLSKMGRIEYKGVVKYTWLLGMPTDEGLEIITDMQQWKIKEGRNIKEGDKKKVVIGKLLADGTLLDSKIDIGNSIKIQDVGFEVVGIVDEIGNPQDDAQVYITLEDAREIAEEPEKVDFIFIKLQKTADVSTTAEKIRKELAKYRDVEKGEEDFVVQTMDELMDTYSTVFDVVIAVLIGIAAISLVVGGIGIMNTMYTSVLERTKEIGIMKAVGARNSQVMWLFLIEAGMLGLVGGIIGIIFGMSLAELVILGAVQAGVTMLKAYFPPYLIVGSLFFSFLIGAASGVLPAKKASELKPIDALRYE